MLRISSLPYFIFQVFDLAVWYGLQAKQAMQSAAALLNANTVSPGPNGRNSISGSALRKSKRRQHTGLPADQQQNNTDLCGSQRSIWKKLLCLR